MGDFTTSTIHYLETGISPEYFTTWNGRFHYLNNYYRETGISPKPSLPGMGDFTTSTFHYPETEISPPEHQNIHYLEIETSLPHYFTT